MNQKSSMFDCAESDRSKWFGRLELNHNFYREGGPIIDRFMDEYRWLSNFHFTKVPDKSTEHFFQAAKARKDEEGKEWRHRILNAATPSEAKKLGGKVPLRDDWNGIKYYVMSVALAYKFMGSYELYKKLVDTKDSYLIEGTVWHDNIWGICIKKDCEKCKDIKGKNMLGNTLMDLRQILQESIYDVAKGNEKKERELLAIGLDETNKEVTNRGIL